MNTVTIDTSSPVLVTGATGYIAGVLIQKLLEAGVTVHATVRDPSKKENLRYLNDAADQSKGKLRFFRGDLMDSGSFDDAMRGCQVVFHTASPFVMSVKDPVNELIHPAVQGTENVLYAASKISSVKTVVLTSSVAAIRGDASDGLAAPNQTLNESDWNRTSTINYNPYALSKTMAEQRAWVIAGSQRQWKLVVINPGFVLGPGLKYHDSSESFGGIKCFGNGTFKRGAPNLPITIVDVREVAQAHIAAAYLPDSQGRHILVGHNATFLEIGKALAEKYGNDYPQIPVRTLPLPKVLMWLIAPYVGLGRQYIYNNYNVTNTKVDGSKAEHELGIVYRPLHETCADMFQQLIEADVLEKK